MGLAIFSVIFFPVFIGYLYGLRSPHHPSYDRVP
jgi:hypothetical protein